MMFDVQVAFRFDLIWHITDQQQRLRGFYLLCTTDIPGQIYSHSKK